MPGLSITLETARNTLLNTQVEIQTASQNISNAENTSYARQKVILGSNPAIFTGAGWVGMGASVQNIIQTRDQFIDKRLLQSNSQESQCKTLSSQLSVAQTSFSDNGESGISQALGAFWDSWEALGQNPRGLPEQTGVMQSAQGLVDAINTTYKDLKGIADTDIPTGINDAITKADALIQQIADYNRQIVQSETPGYTANDLRDARYQALKDLSAIVPIQYSEDPNIPGYVNVSTTDGTSQIALVNHTQALSLHYDSTSQIITYDNPDGTAGTAANAFPGGSLGGLLIAQGRINNYIQSLTNFTTTLATQVNSQHNQGTGGTDVFTQDPAVLQPSQLLAVAPTFQIDQSTAEYDRAVNIADLQDQEFNFGDGTASFANYLANIQHTMGLDQQDAQSQASFNETLRTNLETQQQSVSGVSIDEEMVDLLKHQQVYQAAAKLIQQVNDLMNKLIDSV